MAAATSLPNDMVYNLSTVGHGDHDHDWDDYIDYSTEKGVVYDSHDYTYGVPVNRADIRPFKDIPADMVDADTKYFINPTGRSIHVDRIIYMLQLRSAMQDCTEP